MNAADVAHLVVDVVFGILILMAYRRVRRDSPLVATIMAAGIIARGALGTTLFWISYLELPFLRALQGTDGFWTIAPDARTYYGAAIAVSAGRSASTITSISPAFVNTLSGWMSLVGWTPASGLFLNVALYVLLCVLVVGAFRPSGDRTAQTACAICLVPFSIAPVLLAHSSQPMKDDMFVFLSAVTCLSVLVLLRGRGQTGRDQAQQWRLLAALASLGAAAYVMGGIRLYFTAVVSACLVPAALLYVWRSRSVDLRRSLLIAIATVMVASLNPAYRGAAEVRRWIAPARTAPAAGSGAAPAAPRRPLRGGLVLWEYALTSLRESRLAVEQLGGATSIVSRPALEQAFVRPALIGLATTLVPISLVKALGWADFPGGRGLLWIADIDTLLLDLSILACVAVVARHRARIGPNAPYLWFVAGVGLVTGVLLGFVVTNFGLLLRLRLMMAVPLWLLPLALTGERERGKGEGGRGKGESRLGA